MGHLTFADGTVEEGARLTVITNAGEGTGHLDLQRLRVRGELRVSLVTSRSPQPPLVLDWLKLDGGEVVVRRPLKLSKDPSLTRRTRLRAGDWEIAPGSRVDFPQALVDDGTIEWGFVFRTPDLPEDSVLTFQPAVVPDDD